MALNYEQLSKLPALKGFVPAELDALFAIPKRITANSGDRIITAGDLADCFFIVAEGALEVQVEANGTKIPVAQLGAGQLVGEMPLVYNQPTRQADVVCSAPSKLLRFDYADYEALGKLHPDLAKKFRSNLGKIVASRVWATPGKTGLLNPAAVSGGSGTHPVPSPRPSSGKSQSREAMKRAQIFSGLNDDELDGLEEIAQQYPVERGQVLCSVGDPANSFFLVTKGQLEIQIEEGGRAFPLARLGPGQCVGEMALIYKSNKRSATVVAVDSSHMLMWEFDAFNRLVAKEVNIGRRLRSNLGRVAASRSWALPEADEARSLKDRGPQGTGEQ